MARRIWLFCLSHPSCFPPNCVCCRCPTSPSVPKTCRPASPTCRPSRPTSNPPASPTCRRRPKSPPSSKMRPRQSSKSRPFSKTCRHCSRSRLASASSCLRPCSTGPPCPTSGRHRRPTRRSPTGSGSPRAPSVRPSKHPARRGGSATRPAPSRWPGMCRAARPRPWRAPGPPSAAERPRRRGRRCCASSRSSPAAPSPRRPALPEGPASRPRPRCCCSPT
mmetsp:Transcript_65459/g.188617  ORF Transcript_65459/g.188617 Transcript_65459/m.188617 type:complete len:221 (-) Transcript_65459:1144-1806(-)